MFKAVSFGIGQLASVANQAERTSELTGYGKFFEDHCRSFLGAFPIQHTWIESNATSFAQHYEDLCRISDQVLAVYQNWLVGNVGANEVEQDPQLVVATLRWLILLVGAHTHLRRV